ncbi:phosphatase PAP2 family protein [Actinokineospora auranticolor]|uniref:Undecaprenyl-diphosphatase n=1 Tax=Actinokineospora auranticolor TaxID=155976 RepID=A0A2S6GDB6_9PSEU|nr:phosphatase PAP2 family protein [Actinokineospora auranticolor]PPK63202.1 undecaprenyl-diphosphatase [Actinokineospora auranticolor]
MTGALLGFAERTPWLHTIVSAYTNGALFLLAIVMVVAWWRARRRSPVVAATALWAPVAVLLAYGVSNLVKVLVREPRPCQVLHVVTVAPCDYVTDYALPSNHATVAAAAAVGILLTDRAQGLTATALTLLVGVSRVYLGAHYPHDVLIGFLVGAAIGATGLWAHRLLVDRVPPVLITTRSHPASVPSTPRERP